MTDPEDAEAFITALYRTLLKRDPDPDGLAVWVGQILAGVSHATVLGEMTKSAEYQAHVQPKLWMPPGHFYSPVTAPEDVKRHLARIEHEFVSESLPGISINKANMVEFWNKLVPHLKTIPFGEDEKEGLRYKFNNDAYGWGDGSILYAMISHFRPKKIIEIGSGWSSACTIDTVNTVLAGNCDIVFIEPFPRVLKMVLNDYSHRTTLLDQPVQTVDLTLFDALESGDILFIDSTHVLRTGSDVCFELFEILPRLASGVIVHFHDIFWPFEYPSAWSVDESRSWNEIYAIRAMLSFTDQWQILFFNNYVARFAGDLINQTYPDFYRNSGGALWIRKS